MSDLFEKTAEVLDKYGWMQGERGDQEIGYCIMGALMQAQLEQRYGTYIPKEYSKGWCMAMSNPIIAGAVQSARWILDKIVLEETSYGDIGVINYNDVPSTTLEDIKLLLKKGSERAALDTAAS